MLHTNQGFGNLTRTRAILSARIPKHVSPLVSASQLEKLAATLVTCSVSSFGCETEHKSTVEKTILVRLHFTIYSCMRKDADSVHHLQIGSLPELAHELGFSIHLYHTGHLNEVLIQVIIGEHKTTTTTYHVNKNFSPTDSSIIRPGLKWLRDRTRLVIATCGYALGKQNGMKGGCTYTVSDTRGPPPSSAPHAT